MSHDMCYTNEQVKVCISLLLAYRTCAILMPSQTRTTVGGKNYGVRGMGDKSRASAVVPLGPMPDRKKKRRHKQVEVVLKLLATRKTKKRA